jgi:hypothetical protein
MMRTHPDLHWSRHPLQHRVRRRTAAASTALVADFQPAQVCHPVAPAEPAIPTRPPVQAAQLGSNRATSRSNAKLAGLASTCAATGRPAGRPLDLYPTTVVKLPLGSNSPFNSNVIIAAGRSTGRAGNLPPLRFLFTGGRPVGQAWGCAATGTELGAPSERQHDDPGRLASAL